MSEDQTLQLFPGERSRHRGVIPLVIFLRGWHPGYVRPSFSVWNDYAIIKKNRQPFWDLELNSRSWRMTSFE